MWGNTYCCEQFFSCMKTSIKTAERNRLSDSHFTNILRIKTNTMKADIDNIIKGKKMSKITLNLFYFVHVYFLLFFLSIIQYIL